MIEIVLVIEFKGILKVFGLVQVNKDIFICVMFGMIYGIIGENGVGKLMLMLIFYGFYKVDSGEIYVNGECIEIFDSEVVINVGIGMVFQYFKLVENFIVFENIILGVEDGGLLCFSLNKVCFILKQFVEEYELNVDFDVIIEDLGVGMQQCVEIFKVLYCCVDILIFDELIGVLIFVEVDQLFCILGCLCEEGKMIILIMYKFCEIMDIIDIVLVMCCGQMMVIVKIVDINFQ